jgi:hypothetical protein
MDTSKKGFWHGSKGLAFHFLAGFGCVIASTNAGALHCGFNLALLKLDGFELGAHP